MRFFVLTLALLIPFYAVAIDIKDVRFYQTDNIVPNGRTPHYSVYIKNDNPCIFVDDLRKSRTTEYCDIEGTDYNFKNDFPSIYPINLRLSGASLYFIVAAPWDEQKCEIFFPENSITCESTGKN